MIMLLIRIGRLLLQTAVRCATYAVPPKCLCGWLTSESISQSIFILAHPDDEIFCAGLICELRRRQIPIHLFASRFPTATIISLELEANNYRMLQKNTVHEPRIHPLHCGLWSIDGTLSVANESAHSWAHYAVESSNDEIDCNTTPSLSVASLMKRYNIPTIDLLKLDIEGAEKEVLSTADQWIEKVKTIAVEVHDWLKPGCSDALESAIKGRCFNRTQVGDYIILQNTFEDFSSEHSN